jgi:hypothetical protein
MDNQFLLHMWYLGAGTDYPSRDTTGASFGTGTDCRPETQRVPHVEQELIIRPEKHQVPNVEQELLIRPEYLELPPDSCCSKLNFLCNIWSFQSEKKV